MKTNRERAQLETAASGTSSKRKNSERFVTHIPGERGRNPRTRRKAKIQHKSSKGAKKQKRNRTGREKSSREPGSKEGTSQHKWTRGWRTVGSQDQKREEQNEEKGSTKTATDKAKIERTTDRKGGKVSAGMPKEGRGRGRPRKNDEKGKTAH